MGADESKILLVDDDRSLTEVLAMALEEAGFTVRVAADGRAGWEAFADQTPDLAVLDLLMPELDGLQLCQLIREAGHATPIILLTSRAEEMDKVLGLEMGADDYVTKPFSTRELVARIRAALRRVARYASPPPQGAASLPQELREGPLRLDRARRRVWVGEREVGLTTTEFELLWVLAERPDHVASRGGLIDRVYGKQVVVSDRTIDTFIKRLRQKLAAARPGYSPLQTVRGVGYRFGEEDPP